MKLPFGRKSNTPLLRELLLPAWRDSLEEHWLHLLGSSSQESRSNPCTSMLKSLIVHRLVIAVLLAITAVLLFRESSRDVRGNAGSRIRASAGAPDVVPDPLAERLREAGRPEFPIQFDADMNEYQLVYSYTNADGSRVVSRSPLHFDPFTGARLPESTRHVH